MNALQSWTVRLAIAILVVTALVTPPAGAGGNDHRKDRLNKKDLDHFACYEAAEHVVDKDVKIINQFTRDDDGYIAAQQITVGALVLLCVPTQKILIDDHAHH